MIFSCHLQTIVLLMGMSFCNQYRYNFWTYSAFLKSVVHNTPALVNVGLAYFVQPN